MANWLDFETLMEISSASMNRLSRLHTDSIGNPIERMPLLMYNCHYE